MAEFTKNYCRGCEHKDKDCCPGILGYYYTGVKDYIKKCDRFKKWQEEQDLNLKYRRSHVDIDFNFDDYLGEKSKDSMKKLRYISNHPGDFLKGTFYIYGGNGTQKTSMSRVMGRELIKKGYTVHYILMEDLINLIMDAEDFDAEKANKAQKEVSKLYLIDFLIIDESFDRTKVTLFKSGYQLPFLDKFLRKRLENIRKTTFFISNETIDSIENSGYGKSIQNLIERNVKGNIIEFHDNYQELLQFTGCRDNNGKIDMFAGINLDD